MTTDLDRLAELGRAVEKTREPFSPGMAGLSWHDEGERDSDFLSFLIESLRAALAERIASELELAEECERLNCENANLRAQAATWAQEANTQTATVHECYQAVTAATGEPGDWNGAVPVTNELQRLRDENVRLRGQLTAALNCPTPHTPCASRADDVCQFGAVQVARLAELEAEVERLKVCGNCQTWWDNIEGCSNSCLGRPAHEHCYQTPSRWEPRP